MRILHLPLEISGQVSMISREQRRLGYQSDVLLFRPSAFQYVYDYSLHLKRGIYHPISLLRRFQALLKVMGKYDIFHFHYCQSFIPLHFDLLLLRLFGKKVFMHYWGSDIRLCYLATKFTKFSWVELDAFSKCRRDPLRILQIHITRLFAKTIVGDYHLLPYSPKSIVIKQAIDLSKFPYVGSPNSEKVLIVHAPSDRTAKGSAYIKSAIERLASEENNIHLILVEKLPHHEAIEIYKKADIIVDQILGESYGTLAIETMAMGKPVLCRVDRRFLKFYPDCPLVNTDKDNVYTNIKKLVHNKKLREDLGLKGRQFVEKVHASMKIAKQLLTLYCED